ncbi:MAG: CHRD domain-containing protein [Sphingobium sp.]|nr:CHRD domain-containing protein [Sphingobium sp.]
MPRFRMIAALAATGLAAGALVTAAVASPIPEDTKYVRTWVLVPMTAAAEVPGPGATAASGDATMQVDWAARKFCFAFNVKGLDGPITAAHLHKGAVGVAGGPVVTFKKGTRSQTWEGCADVTPELAADILAKPTDYYVNVHTAGFPAGALRAQLTDTNDTLTR